MPAKNGLKIPPAVKREAAKAVSLHESGYAGGMQTGWNRAYQLRDDDTIGAYDLKIMRAWFARHVFTSNPGYQKWLKASKQERASKSKWRGAVAWLLWGGDPAYEWVSSEKVKKFIESNL